MVAARFFCAICTRDVRDAEPARQPLGRGGALVVVCSACNEERPTQRLGPERGYESGGAMPSLAEVARGARLVLGTGRLGTGIENRRAYSAVSVLRAKSSGWLIVRVPRRDTRGRARDQRDAYRTLRAKPWFRDIEPLGSDGRYYLFQRPDPAARVAPDVRDVRGELAKLSKAAS